MLLSPIYKKYRLILRWEKSSFSNLAESYSRSKAFGFSCKNNVLKQSVLTVNCFILPLKVFAL